MHNDVRVDIAFRFRGRIIQLSLPLNFDEPLRILAMTIVLAVHTPVGKFALQVQTEPERQAPLADVDIEEMCIFGLEAFERPVHRFPDFTCCWQRHRIAPTSAGFHASGPIYISPTSLD